MTAQPTPEVSTTKTCQCGCGAPVARSFLPGHDAKLKSALVEATRSNRWWVRESAAHVLVNRGWGHFIDSEVLAQLPVRSRHNGRFCRSVHLDSVEVWTNDTHGLSHGNATCPAAKGETTQDTEATGWVCGACVHTHDTAERVGRHGVLMEALDAEREARRAAEQAA